MCIFALEMDNISVIKAPIEKEMGEFRDLFRESLSHTDGLLNHALNHILQRGGKMMRPMLVLLTAKNYGVVNNSTLDCAVGLELLHTASLVHDDVVDESLERRGQKSTNAIYNNKVSILVGDYILSTALFYVAKTEDARIMSNLAEIGRILSNGEIDQLSTIASKEISEENYYNVIRQKTAALFSACSRLGAMSVDATEEEIAEADKFGENLGIIFQIKDDIFDYYDSIDIGKPTGNDMREGKLTLPAIYVLTSTQNKDMLALATKIKQRTISEEEIASLVDFTIQNGGIKYAEQKMKEFSEACLLYINKCRNESIKSALNAYLNYVIQREF